MVSLVIGARRSAGRAILQKRIAAVFLAAAVLGAAGDAGTCDATGTCAAAGGGLRWRGYPYQVRDPRHAKTVYGGDFIREAFARAGYEGPEAGEDWDVLWTHRPQTRALEQLELQPRPSGQRLVNHCDYFSAAGDKCSLARHVRRLADRLDTDELRVLRTYELDDAEELASWRRVVLDRPEQHWLLKPCLGGASKGIAIHRGQALLDAQRRFGGRSVAQEYLEDPYMGLGGRKFHLRLYVLVTGWSPTVAYLYDEGLVFRSRHAHARAGARDQARDVFSSISGDVEALPLAALWAALDAPGAAPALSARTRGRIVALLSAHLGAEVEASFGAFAGRRGYGCFDLLGADVLLDEALRPALMEVNTGPNMWVDDRGAEHREGLLAAKAPLVAQLLHWAADRCRGGGDPRLLVNFTRLP